MPSSTLTRLLLLLALVGMGMGLHGWVAAQGDGALVGDEAIYGQLAEHLLATGEAPPIYVPGQPHVGTAVIWLIAAVLDSPFEFSTPALAVRMANVALFGLFLLLHGWLAYKLWGGQVALLSVGLAAVPSGAILWWTHRPVGGLGLVLVCGTAALLLSELRLDVPAVHYGRLILLGLVVGVGLWTNQLMWFYTAVIVALWLLRTAEWRILYQRVAVGLWPMAGVGLASLGVVAFFAAACLPAQWHTAAQLILLAVVGWTAIGFGWVSPRIYALLWQGIALGGGVAVGSWPVWWAFFGRGQSLPSPLAPACPAAIGGRAWLVLSDLIPRVWGGGWLLAWLAVPIMVGLVGYFLWYWRYVWAAVFTLRPLVEDDVRVLLPVFLLLLPLAALVLGGHGLDGLAVRHLLPFWQAGTVIAAWGVQVGARQRPRTAVALVAFLVLHQLVAVWLAV